MSNLPQSQDTIRPGNFSFPVVTGALGAGNDAAEVGKARNTKVQAGALAALLALQVGGVPLGGTTPTIAACAAILVFGLPHGALDLEIIKRERGTGRLAMGGLLILYVGLAAVMAAVWQLAPVAALAMFLIVAVVHFAEDWPELRSRFLAQGMAIALLAAPALLHVTELEQLFEMLSGSRDGALVANLLLLLAPTSVAVASVAVWTLWRAGARDQAVVGALMLVGMILLPPVVGFAFFFCLCHSPKHLGLALSRVARAPSAPRLIVLITLAALGIAAALFAGNVRDDLPAQVVAASFMTLSLLTVPHMIVPVVIEALAQRWSGACSSCPRTTAQSVALPRQSTGEENADQGPP